MGFPTKNAQFAVFWGYHHLRKHPYIRSCIYMFIIRLDKIQCDLCILSDAKQRLEITFPLMPEIGQQKMEVTYPHSQKEGPLNGTLGDETLQNANVCC